LKVAQAVRKRIDTATITCRELSKLLQKRRESDVVMKNSCTDMFSLVADEGATVFPALTAFKETFNTVGAAYHESANTLEQECVARAAGLMDSFSAQTQKAKGEVGSHVKELQAARELCQQTYSKQEKALEVASNRGGSKDSEVAAQLSCNPDLDPWLATIAHEAAIKGVESLAAKQQDAFHRGVNDVLAADDRRLEATKSLLLVLLQNEKKKLEAHLAAVESLFDCVQDINPSSDAHDFLSHYSISEADLLRNKKEAAQSEGGAQPPDMGVWIPDESVKSCTQVRPSLSFSARCLTQCMAQCTASFSMFKRKHHCRFTSAMRIFIFFCFSYFSAQILWSRFLCRLYSPQRHAARSIRIQ